MPNDRVHIEFEGLEDIKKVLNQMPRNLQRRTLLRAFRKGAKPVVSAMRRITPEDARAYDDKYTGDSGQLRESIGIITGKSRRNTAANLYIGARHRSGKWRNAKRGGWYFHFVSKGTKHQKAQLIPERTWNQTSGDVENIILDELSDAVYDTMQKTIKKNHAKRG